MEKNEQDIKLQLLQSLLDHLDNLSGESLSSKFKPKMSVEVAAPDKEGLTEGLEKAHELAESPELEHLDSDSHEDESDDSDESRILDLLGKDDDDEERKPLGDMFSR